MPTYPLFAPGIIELGHRCTNDLGQVVEKLTKTSRVTTMPRVGTVWALVPESITLAQVESLLAERVGGRQPSAAFTPAALGPDLLAWGDSTTVNATNGLLTSWASKGSLPLVLRPVQKAPAVASGVVRFNGTPLTSETPLPLPRDWSCLVVVQNVDFSQQVDFVQLGNYVVQLGVEAGQAFGFAKPEYQKRAALPAPAGKGPHVLLLSYNNEAGRIRLSVNGVGFYDYPGTPPLVSPGEVLQLGGERSSNGSILNPLTGEVLEWAFQQVSDQATLRKLEGYARLRYGCSLPDTHPYATTDPLLVEVSVPNLTPILS